MAGQTRAIREALRGLHYGPRLMVYSLNCQHWFFGNVIGVNGDILTITYPGWESSENDDVHKLSDRLDRSTGGRPKWQGVQSFRGAFRRVWPEWTPTGAQLDPAKLAELTGGAAAKNKRKGKGQVRRQLQRAAAAGNTGQAAAGGQAAASGQGDRSDQHTDEGSDGSDCDEDGNGDGAGSAGGTEPSDGGGGLRPAKRRRLQTREGAQDAAQRKEGKRHRLQRAAAAGQAAGSPLARRRRGSWPREHSSDPGDSGDDGEKSDTDGEDGDGGAAEETSDSPGERRPARRRRLGGSEGRRRTRSNPAEQQAGALHGLSHGSHGGSHVAEAGPSSGQRLSSGVQELPLRGGHCGGRRGGQPAEQQQGREAGQEVDEESSASEEEDTVPAATTTTAVTARTTREMARGSPSVLAAEGGYRAAAGVEAEAGALVAALAGATARVAAGSKVVTS
ncbi:hypothetical protein PLESTM_000360500 [Pleodorina starrii]|nr:hypothetical protein PLESTM_000360500 [Pleodorina starrii]